MSKITRKQFDRVASKWLADTQDVMSVTAHRLGAYLDRKVAVGELSPEVAEQFKADCERMIEETLASAREELSQVKGA